MTPVALAMAPEIALRRPIAAVAMPTPTMARMRAYSAAEAPDSSCRKFTSLIMITLFGDLDPTMGLREAGLSQYGTFDGGPIAHIAECAPTAALGAKPPSRGSMSRIRSHRACRMRRSAVMARRLATV